MKYLFALVISLLSLIGLKQVAHAETSVNVNTNSGGGNTTHVSVNSNVKSSSISTTTVNSNTKVHIESDGEVKDFNTTGDESVNWESEDGKSSVKINSNPQANPEPTSKLTEKPTLTPRGTESAKIKSAPAKNASYSFFQNVLEKFFSFFGFFRKNN